MYINTGYLNHSHLDFKDKSRPLVVGSCGIYRLSGDPRMPTYRPKGRLDYQIIYIASGLGHFHMKMSKSGCDIDYLIIQASLWAVGRHPRIAAQTIDAAASDDERAAFVLEIQMGMI